MQEIILQLWLVFGTFKGNSKIGTWIYRVRLVIFLLACMFKRSYQKYPDELKLVLKQITVNKTFLIKKRSYHLIYYTTSLKTGVRIQNQWLYLRTYGVVRFDQSVNSSISCIRLFPKYFCLKN
jgi:hypothetical protein